MKQDKHLIEGQKCSNCINFAYRDTVYGFCYLNEGNTLNSMCCYNFKHKDLKTKGDVSGDANPKS